MSDAQFGLVVATPIIIGFAITLNRMGVLQRGATLSAITASVAIGAILFLGQ